MYEDFLQVEDVEKWELVRFKSVSEMSAHEREVTGDVDADAGDGIEESSIRFSPDLVDERIKASPERLHAQISALTQIMDRLIQSNSAKETTTASSRETRHQYESPFSVITGSSRFPTVAPLTTAGYSLDMVTGASRTSHQQRPPKPQHADMDTDYETVFPNRNRKGEYSETSDVTEQYENIIDGITTLPNILQNTNTNQTFFTHKSLRSDETKIRSMNFHWLFHGVCFLVDTERTQFFFNARALTKKVVHCFVWFVAKVANKIAFLAFTSQNLLAWVTFPNQFTERILLEG